MEIKLMNHHEMNDYMLAMPIIQAQEQKLLIPVSSYPHMKEAHQKKLISEMDRSAQLEQEEFDSIDIAKHLGLA